MSNERDITIERLEQKLASHDKEIAHINSELRKSIIGEMEKKLEEKFKLWETSLEDTRMKFDEKFNDIVEMNKSLRDSIIEQKSSERDDVHDVENRLIKIERRIAEINSAYTGVMNELLDQKSILREKITKAPQISQTPQTPKMQQKEEPEQKIPKNEYIIADNYEPRDTKKPHSVMEISEIKTDTKLKTIEKSEKPKIRKIKKISEGVEIFETVKGDE